MSSTTATLKRSGETLIPQAYAPETTTYEAVTARQIGSSCEFGFQVLVRGWTPFAREIITVTSSGQSLNSTTYGNALLAHVEVSGGRVHFRLNGTAASTSLDHRLEDGDLLVLESSGEIFNFRTVLGSSVSSSLIVHYST